MRLVIVESPAKCQTIGKYLGNDYKVVASYGHIRDLATKGKGGLGVDIEKDFAPSYVICKDKTKVVSELKKNSSKAEEIILATDPDREGEAIAWHLCDVLNLNVETTKRLEFHEITKSALTSAMEEPRALNLSLVESQETRRILDRIMGFQMSVLLKRKIKMESAGRVQSAALKMLVDHEKEIQSFISEEYWTIKGQAVQGSKVINISLDSVDDKKVTRVANKEEADTILARTKDPLIVEVIDKTIKTRESKAPFTTSTLQQEAFNYYKFSSRKTALLSQNLYEGKQLENETVGLITYIRTDSTRISPAFVDNAAKYILDNFGEQYLSIKGTKQPKKQVQDAHEAIRPTSLELTPAKVKPFLSRDEYQLYKLIYNRTLAAFMAARKDESTTIIFRTNGITFKAEGSVPVFDGYMHIYKDSENENEEKNILPSVIKGDTFALEQISAEENHTKAPARFSEAKLIKMMEEKGIGRPSTYASTITILSKRKYVISEGGYLVPTKEGLQTIDYLDQYFSRVINTNFTAEMEGNLDDVAANRDRRIDVLNRFWELFTPIYENAKNSSYETPQQYLPEQVGTCSKCGSPLIKKRSKYGTFVACSNYPTCHYIEKGESPKLEYTGENCPECGKPMLFRKNKKGEKFEACSGFPQCRYIKTNMTKEEPIIIKTCPDCGGNLVIKKGKKRVSFLGCSNYPKCTHMEKYSVKKE